MSPELTDLSHDEMMWGRAFMGRVGAGSVWRSSLGGPVP
jgi:hypothetical protein